MGIIDVGRIIVLDTPKKLTAQLGGDKIILKTKKPNIAALKKLGCIKSMRRKGEKLELVVSEDGRNLKKILEMAGQVKDVEIKPTTLNDVFLHYTGRQIREAEPEGGFWERMMGERRE